MTVDASASVVELVAERFAVASTQPKDVLVRMRTPNLGPRLGEIGHPIFVFWGLNDDVSLIILGAVQSAGRADQIKVMSVDGSPSGKTSVKDGGLYATAAQSPVSLGKKAVECAYTLLDGGTVDAEYSLDTTLVTPDNVNDMSPDSWS